MGSNGSNGDLVSHAPAGQQRGRLLELDVDVFRAGFDRSPFRLRHRLADHPLFSIERLLELSRRLPEANVEYNAGALPIGQDPSVTPRNGLSVQETIERIATCKSWLVLKDVEQDPEYAVLLDECLGEVRELSEPLDPGMCEKEAFVFITSPGSVTPFHIDIEHNFLLQIRGTKFFNIWPHDDRSVLSEEEIESFYCGAHRNLVYKDEYGPKGQCFELHPGDGLHSPITCPHWVRNGDEVSISFSVTFRTPRSHRRGHVYMLNSRLREWNLTPRPYGASPLRDGLKSLAWRGLHRIDALVGRKNGAAAGY